MIRRNRRERERGEKEKGAIAKITGKLRLSIRRTGNTDLLVQSRLKYAEGGGGWCCSPEQFLSIKLLARYLERSLAKGLHESITRAEND